METTKQKMDNRIYSNEHVSIRKFSSAAELKDEIRNRIISRLHLQWYLVSIVDKGSYLSLEFIQKRLL